MTDITEGLKSIFTSVLAESAREKEELVQSLGDSEEVRKASEALASFNLPMFHYTFAHRLEGLLEGVIARQFPNSREAQFLALHYNFVDMHISKLIKTMEDWPCSADKTRTIIRALLKFYATGEKIQFDYAGEYTFHLPKRILKTHEDIVEFVSGLQRLYMGDPTAYLHAYGKILATPAVEA